MSATIKECVAEHKELLQVHDHCPERAYVEVQVPADAKKVVVVNFTAVSHDQGDTKCIVPWTLLLHLNRLGGQEGRAIMHVV